MDIAKFDFNEAKPQTLELQHPVDGTTLLGDDGEPLTITLYSADSDHFRSIVRQYGNKKLNEKRNKKQRMEELEETSSRILAKATVDWSNIVENGELLEYSEEAAYKLYDGYAWIREQVDEFVNERSNFLRRA